MLLPGHRPQVRPQVGRVVLVAFHRADELQHPLRQLGRLGRLGQRLGCLGLNSERTRPNLKATPSAQPAPDTDWSPVTIHP